MVIEQVRTPDILAWSGSVRHIYVVRIDQDDPEFLERYKTVSSGKH